MAAATHGATLIWDKRVPGGAEVAAELLAKQSGSSSSMTRVRTQVAAAGPVVAERGIMTLNSVNSPGWVSTSIDPACCLTIMS